MKNFVEFNSNTVTINWNNIWASRGHILGEGMISPDKKYFYIKIPKNSSSFAVKHLLDLGWMHSSKDIHPDATIIVALRDPLDRWISGIIEYLFMYHIDQIDSIVSKPDDFDFWPLIGERLGLSLLFDQLTFDDHTALQSMFLNTVNLSKCQALIVDEQFSNNFSSMLTKLGYSNNLYDAEKVNSKDETNPLANRRKLLRQVISFILERDHEKKEKLLVHLQPDYHLLKSINFFGDKNV